MPLPDPCFLTINPPLTLSNITSYLSDQNFYVSLKPNFNPVSMSCIYSITLQVFKSVSIDTTGAVVSFNNM